MTEDRSRYYKLKLFNPDGNEVSKFTLRIYPEDENGEKWAKMQGAMLGQRIALDAMHNAETGWTRQTSRLVRDVWRRVRGEADALG